MNGNLLFQNGLHVLKIDSHARNTKVFDNEFNFYSEEFFHIMLAMERKRTERSGKPILFVTLDIGDILDSLSKKDITRDISLVLHATTRDIDIKGWFKSGKKIGVIYTEMTKSGKEPIMKRIHYNLGLVFGHDNAPKIEVAYASFPRQDNENAGDNACIADICFYPSPYKYAPLKRASLAMKRGLDIICSGILILLFSPAFIIIALLVRCTSTGPVFFRQARIGLGGKRFTFYKFRSMRVDSDSSVHEEYIKKLIQGGSGNGGGKNGVYKIINDPRVTRIGKFIRKTSLDEIPQFFNVLKGDMSLVGPRPPIPYEIENYKTWHKRRVLEVKPGITGFWQVAGRSTTTFDTMVRMDLQYAVRWSLWWDVKLMFQTPLAVFKGAY
jgi:lipopolysaccharide/colanic/teichoic acid biosynthesis glycosyltransferase